MSTDSMPDWSPDPEIASLLGREREDVPSGAGATARIWHRLEMHSVGVAAAASLVPGAARVEASDVASGAAGVASAGATKALAWKLGAASMLLLAGGAIGASIQARLTPAPLAPVTLAPTPVAATRSHAPPEQPAPDEHAKTPVSVDVEALPRAPAPAVILATRPAPLSASSASGSTPATSPSATATSLGEEQRLLDTARAAVARGAYSSALGSLTEHQTRFPSGRLTEERELLFVQALAGAGATDAARARARAFAERFPGSIFLPAVRALSASQER